ncbi:acyl-CoA synthetase (AMP-forming)/AMP-acid ligase II [Bradyrhizobium sp. USDA 4524]|uniref:class I adenylate-forming enzyme family protein n=1 Tax=unclassified Bradyrhizobium TaxID=2631580 RepID=UPI00209D4643|nr:MULTISPECIES: class I adenylate-forming enzyme family protein [unclassified Bradyrhizobium]MCP1838680.1 long-chain acyl-CoA synthetase/crotonobetaine/carnitine-CoA ligase [Bradyrhizobium sp. USDA 4538]MCP1899246.1 long-chain acyl-CoA synthetase/crotonobetaine/carnitine-CoA ligase [Bradyrhizobium sp. USDA 4537]MCP1986642.1 long-chain acyl-CoA synthetase/crotonobetaine/carnitine-CoA ligase [Bradyrhizobium sp. USDA 4539]
MVVSVTRMLDGPKLTAGLGDRQLRQLLGEDVSSVSKCFFSLLSTVLIMPSLKVTQTQLQERVANVLRAIEALESEYETITIGQLVSRRARTHSSTIAIDIFDRGERATYSEMDRWSNKYAQALRTLGVHKGDRIGVMLPNRIEFPLLWFAIAKLGAVMVPINMRYTPREIEYVLSDTQAKFAVIDGAAWSVFSVMEAWPRDLAKERVILIGQPSQGTATSLQELLEGVDDSPVEEDIRPDDLLNIQYTSGTTGFPKGCMLTHDYWGMYSYQGVCWERPYKRYLSAQPFFYVDPPAHLLKAYRQGGTLFLAPQLSSTRFVGWVKRHRIEWCQFPQLVAREAEAANTDGTTCLKQVLNWGWSPETVRQFRNRFRVRTEEAYGMTEIGFGTRMTNWFDELADSSSVGMRAPFRTLRLMNEDGSPTPIGDVGELWVRGRGIFKGYWNNPNANAALFEGEWFKTGDLMRCDELGFHWLVGRTKDMIRRSSENIAARELEAVIREIPEITDVAAVPVSDAKRGEEVKIYVEFSEGVTPDNLAVTRILEHARAHLAAFKVPRYIAFTRALPRATTSNKVLKHELMSVSDPLAGTYDTEEGRWR